jgi:hypothetical protein
MDVDGDGLNDLIVGAQTWYKQPKTGKHEAKNWRSYSLGKTKWPMSCIPHDVDGDGDQDLVVPDRRHEIFWYVNPGKLAVTQPWERRRLHDYEHPMFMTVGDVNADGVDDFLIASGHEGSGKYLKKLIVLVRTNKTGNPSYDEYIIDQPCGNQPKGVKVFDLDGDPSRQEVVVTPKQGDAWAASFRNGTWKTEVLATPGADTRTKMDNVYVGDLDGDGDQDFLSTEENGGWGVIWFENPAN